MALHGGYPMRGGYILGSAAFVLHRVDGFTLQGGASLCNRFSSLLAQQAARLEAGIALCDGRLMDSTLSLADALPQRADSAATQRIELLWPPACGGLQATGMCFVAEWPEPQWEASWPGWQ